MTHEQEAILLEFYPTLFQNHKKKPAQSPFAAYGFEVEKGWFDLLERLCDNIMKLDPGPDFKVDQIKEKFGGLCIYFSGWPEDHDQCKKISALVTEAERHSKGICELCGTSEGVELKGSWVKAFCPTCRSDFYGKE
jgi:hypothetical protein